MPVRWDRGLRGFNGLEEERKECRGASCLFIRVIREIRGQTRIRSAKASIAQSIVFLQELPHSIVRQRFDPVIVAAGHALILDQRIDDRFLDRLHGGLEDRIEPIVRHGLHRVGRLVRIGRAGVGGREGDEQIAGTIARNTSGAGQAEARDVRAV